MNTAKLVNSALTGGGLIYPENLNVIIGNESKGYPKGYVLDANATLSLAGSNGTSNNINTEDFITKQQFFNIFDANDNGIYLKNKYNSLLLDAFSNVSTLYSFGRSSIAAGFNNIIKSNSISFGNGGYNSANGSYIFGSNNTYFWKFQYVNSDKTKIKFIIDNNEIGQFIANKNYFFYVNSRLAIKSDGFQILKTPNQTGGNYAISCNIESSQIIDGKYHITMKPDQLFKIFAEFDTLIIYTNIIEKTPSFIFGNFNCILNESNYSTILGLENSIYKTKQSFVAGVGLCNFNNISGSAVIGRYNYKDPGEPNLNKVFTVGAGDGFDNRKNALTILNDNNSNLYINGIGGYDGTSINAGNTKSLQQVISDISSNSAPLSSYDSVLKCINSKPTISSNERIEDVIKGVLKKGWKNIALNVTFTKDNVWIVTNTTLFRIGSENKLSNEVTFAEIQSGNYNFIKLEDACKLIRYYGANFYAIVQNVKAKEEYLYDNKPYVHKLAKTLIACGLRKRYSIVSFDADILKKVIEVDDFANVGLFCISEISEESDLKSNISSSISDINMKRYDFNMVSGHGSLFLVCGFNTIKNLNMNAVSSLIENNCDLCIGDLNQTTNIDEVKNMNQYITLAFCNDVHIGKKLLESNV